MVSLVLGGLVGLSVGAFHLCSRKSRRRCGCALAVGATIDVKPVVGDVNVGSLSAHDVVEVWALG